MTDSGVLKYGDLELELPIVEATQGNNGFDISKVLAKTGATTLDPGFVNTASCTSAITFIDGDQGILQYRGYPIEQLAEKATFIEVAYLLIYGELPTQEQLDEFRLKISRRMMLDERMRELYRCFPRGAHPMQVLAAGVMALGSFNRDTLSVHDSAQVEEASLRLLGSMPTLAAYAYKSSVGEPFLYPQTKLGYVENYLRLSFGTPQEEYEIDPAIVRAFETLFILHADHEQNASTSTVRLVGSADANIYASISSGVNALSGPLHGGANQAVLEMLARIHDEGLDIKEFVSLVKDKKSGVKLMGFGHRVYKNYDPRAKIIKGHADELLRNSGRSNRLLEMALELEETALNDEYFIERKLYPNVDFYTGLIYEAMGFPAQHFTALFALGRLPGWIAQWREQHADPTRKIGRPRQIYVGETKRDYVPIAER
ncbi:citrate (Si)-synthase [Tessaracoccus lapidicaptus]|uniref:Citrate synthase n=1 Tax=Tessaracoccus lapidicaptus TaxID=1427523 RepID=A0A1C0AL20_9ACTN|nr:MULTISPECIES: citrate synthase [Tessaracoccus]AQX15988.1 citrate (Si)-synthase [Tessaracoccus sp. T2.5-30]OCL33289.1 citrate (Si)-synthase [Tessaracoccus lapidicaptus]VEP40491.1 Citrate synthase 1 [Tessaracoccus lapidicaptus]